MLRFLILAALLLVAACAPLDTEQARICRLVLPALHPEGTVFRETRIASAEAGRGVRIDYEVSEPDTRTFIRRHWAVCRFGGSALAEIESPWLRRVLSQLDTRPLRSVIVLRAIFGVAPFLNYALALSSLGFRDYIIGSIIGMAAPIAIAAVLLDLAL